MGYYEAPPVTNVFAEQEARATFVARTYLHLFGAVLAFVAVEAWLFTSGQAATIAESLLGVNWLLVLGGFVVVSWLASRVAHTAESLPAQYAALAGFVVAEAIIFVPLLYLAQAVAPGVIESAALVTAAGFTALTGIVFFTRQDFSFLRTVVIWGGGLAMVRSGNSRVRARTALLDRHGRAGGRRDPLRHLERDPPLPRGSLRFLPGG